MARDRAGEEWASSFASRLELGPQLWLMPSSLCPTISRSTQMTPSAAINCLLDPVRFALCGYERGPEGTRLLDRQRKPESRKTPSLPQVLHAASTVGQAAKTSAP